MRVLLLSGLGPTFRNRSYYEGTLLDPSGPTYHAGLDRNFSVSSLRYGEGDAATPVLRPCRSVVSCLTSVTLSYALERTGLEHEAFPLEHVWAGDREPSSTGVDVVGLSTTFICNFPTLRKAVRWVRLRFPGAKLVLGGQFSNLKYALIMSEIPEVDYVVRGDGEIAFPALLDALAGRREMASVPNLVLRDPINGRVVCTDFGYIDLEAFPSPSFQGAYREVPYESMRGCPFSCKFCSYPAASPQWRYKSVGKIVADWMRYVEENGARVVKAMDSTFTVPRDRFRDLLRELPKVRIAWEAYARASDIRDEAGVAALEAAGCTELSLGFESMSNETLQRMSKGTKAEDNHRAAELLSRSEIDYRASFIIGYPGETLDEYGQTHEYLTAGFAGRFLLNVFSLTDETMPVWRDASLHRLQIRDAGNPNFSWSHCGMNSETAHDLFLRTVREVRWNNDHAVHQLWQTQFESPLVPQLGPAGNCRLEKAIERLALVERDYPSQPHEVRKRTQAALEDLRQLGVGVGAARHVFRT